MLLDNLFDKVYSESPIIVDAIVLAIQEYLYTILPYHNETDSEKEGTGRNRVLKNVSDDLAIRKRVMTTNNSFPILPFTNFRWTDINEEQDVRKYTNYGFNTGLQDMGLMARIKFMPSQLEFESTTWVNKNVHMFAVRKLIEKERQRKKTRLTLKKYFFVNNEAIDLPIFVEFDKPDIAKYSDIDWLDKNKINAVSHTFTVKYQDLFIDRNNLSITERIILRVQDQYENILLEKEITE